MEEIWVPLNGHPNYIISNFGQIKNTRKNHIAKIICNKGPYPYAYVGVKSEVIIHKAVGEHFIINDNPEKKTEVIHID